MKTLTSRFLYHLGDIACRIGWYGAYGWCMNKSADLDVDGKVWEKPTDPKAF